jgi:hypothetical protein
MVCQLIGSVFSWSVVWFRRALRTGRADEVLMLDATPTYETLMFMSFDCSSFSTAFSLIYLPSILLNLKWQ